MKIGFIGCGNMGGAIMGGLIKQGKNPEKILVSDPSKEALKRVKEQFGVTVVENNGICAKASDVIILAVKPQYLQNAAVSIADRIDQEKLILSIAAGKSLAFLEGCFGKDKKIIRVMPNTPALVGQGMTAFCVNANVTPKDKKTARDILTSFGDVEEVPEKLMNAVTAVSGSAPAYVFMLIEAMADAAVLDGMSRDQALHFAEKTVLGSAALALKTGKHPGELKDMVCSPGGTTIEGVRVLEKNGFRGTVIEALHETCRKAEKL